MKIILLFKYYKNGNNDLFELATNNKNLSFFNINYINKFFETKIFEEKIYNKLNIDNNSNYTVVLIGLDLLSFDNILNFYASYSQKFLNFPALIYFLSLDYSSENLSEYCEKKKNYIKSKVQIICTEKTKKNNTAKNQILALNEITNISKLTKDIGIFELNLISNSKNPLETLEFDKLSIYLKEHKDIFESKAEEKKEEPSSTFKLTLNQNELQAKNETVLPYLKNTVNQNKENIIQIDQEDLNELYEEDPDGDLDI